MARTGRAVPDGCRIEAAKDVFLYLPETRLVLKIRTVLFMAGAAAVHTNWVARRDQEPNQPAMLQDYLQKTAAGTRIRITDPANRETARTLRAW